MLEQDVRRSKKNIKLKLNLEKNIITP